MIPVMLHAGFVDPPDNMRGQELTGSVAMKEGCFRKTISTRNKAAHKKTILVIPKMICGVEDSAI